MRDVNEQCALTKVRSHLLLILVFVGDELSVQHVEFLGLDVLLPNVFRCRDGHRTEHDQTESEKARTHDNRVLAPEHVGVDKEPIQGHEQHLYIQSVVQRRHVLVDVRRKLAVQEHCAQGDGQHIHGV